MDIVGCDLMLFDILSQFPHCYAAVNAGCDLMLFDILSQFFIRCLTSSTVVI